MLPNRFVAMLETPDNMSIDQQIYWSLVALRNHYDTTAAACANAINRYPFLRSFYLQGTSYIDSTALGEHIGKLHYNKGCALLLDIRDGTDFVGKQEASNTKDKLAKWISFWSSKRNPIANIKIQHNDGSLSDSLAQSSSFLCEHWQPIFEKKLVDLRLAKHCLLPFIKQCPASIHAVISFDSFCEMLKTLRDSGVGLDSAPYSLWINAPDGAKQVLYDAYLYLCDFLLPDDLLQQLLTSRLIFIIKGEQDNDGGGNFIRKPGKLRPLTLSNTDAKIVSKACSIPLTEIAEFTISSIQLDGLPGRQMIEHIINMEGEIIEFVMRKLPNSGILALDIASAFPSLSREYMFCILRRMHFPRRLYRCLFNLHRKTRGRICLRNLLFDLITFDGGVKQGDQSAMLLFILSYDPIILFIAHHLSVPEDNIFGYCDDLALALEDLVVSWPLVKRCFALVAKFSALLINVDKNQFLATDYDRIEDTREALCNIDRQLDRQQINTFIKYLGVILGQNVADLNYVIPLKKYIRSVQFISNLSCGMSTSIFLYNLLAVSTLSYVGMFFPPTDKVLKLENWATQKILNGAWNAIPSAAARCVKDIGFPGQVRSISLISASSAVRAAASSPIQKTIRHLQGIHNGTDISLSSAGRHPLHNSFLFDWHTGLNTYTSTLSGPRPLEPRLFKQKVISKHKSSSLPKYDFTPLIAKRLRIYFENDECHFLALHIKQIYSASPKHIEPMCIANHFRTVTNHWVSSSRFGFARQACHFCQILDYQSNDRIHHSLSCPIFIQAFISFHGLHYNAFNLRRVLAFHQDSRPLSLYASRLSYYFVHLCFLAFNRCRHGDTFCESLFKHLVKNEIRRSKFCRSVFFKLKRTGYSSFLD